MKKAMAVVAVAVILGLILLAGTTLAQQAAPKGNAQGADKLFGGARNGKGLQAERGMIEGRHEGDARRLGRMLYIAVIAPWCKDNAEVQALVDKVIVDRKALLQDEQNRVATFEKVVKAARANDKEALIAAHEQMKTVNEKFKTDLETLTGDLRKLADLLRELRPEPQEGQNPNAMNFEGAGEFDDF